VAAIIADFSVVDDLWRAMRAYERMADSMERTADATEMNQTVFILAGTSSEYTAARQQLNLTPIQANWLTGASRLKGLSSPTVYRVGSWRTLIRIEAIEAALVEVEAEIIDL